MSLYLGSVHHWLYAKINTIETLEVEIANLIKEEIPEGIIFEKRLERLWGVPITHIPLEENIDQQNIHGWLQGTIQNTELRLAAWVTFGVHRNSNLQEGFIELARGMGRKSGTQWNPRKTSHSPFEVYQGIHDFWLEGMPCDRVTRELQNHEDVYEWENTKCIHEEYWDTVEGFVPHYYEIRNAFIEGFVEGAGENYQYTQKNNIIFQLTRIR